MNKHIEEYMQKVIENTRCFVNHKLGYDLVRFSGQHNLRSHLHKVINEYQIETIIDVGANEGQFAFCFWLFAFCFLLVCFVLFAFCFLFVCL